MDNIWIISIYMDNIWIWIPKLPVIYSYIHLRLGIKVSLPQMIFLG